MPGIARLQHVRNYLLDFRDRHSEYIDHHFPQYKGISLIDWNDRDYVRLFDHCTRFDLQRLIEYAGRRQGVAGDADGGSVQE
jgi:hypothetical protein